MAQILVVGDANPDLVLTGDVVPRFGQAEQLLDRAELLLGGSAAIVACGLARLGVSTALAAVLGGDHFGDLVVARLDERGVERSAVSVRAHEPTGLSVILDQGHDRAILTRLGTIPLLDAAQIREAVTRLRPAHVHVASYFLQPVLAAELPDLLRWLRLQQTTVSLDTNWDPDERWLGLGDVLPLVDLILPNQAEERAIAGALGVRSLTELGPRVVIKCGAEGAESHGPDGSVTRAAGLSIDVADATGAGDSFDAGYLAARAHGVLDESVRLRWGTVAGSLSTRDAGGTAAQPTLETLRRWLPDVDREVSSQQGSRDVY